MIRIERLDPAFMAGEHMTILEDPIRVCLRGGHGLAFATRPDPCATVTLDVEIDRHNFETIAAGTRFGWVAPGTAWPFEAFDARGAEVSTSWLEIVDGELVSRRSFVPFMLTTHVEIACSDCLFYAAIQRE